MVANDPLTVLMRNLILGDPEGIYTAANEGRFLGVMARIRERSYAALQRMVGQVIRVPGGTFYAATKRETMAAHQLWATRDNEVAIYLQVKRATARRKPALINTTAEQIVWYLPADCLMRVDEVMDEGWRGQITLTAVEDPLDAGVKVGAFEADVLPKEAAFHRALWNRIEARGNTLSATLEYLRAVGEDSDGYDDSDECDGFW